MYLVGLDHGSFAPILSSSVVRSSGLPFALCAACLNVPQCCMKKSCLCAPASFLLNAYAFLPMHYRQILMPFLSLVPFFFFCRPVTHMIMIISKERVRLVFRSLAWLCTDPIRVVQVSTGVRSFIGLRALMRSLVRVYLYGELTCTLHVRIRAFHDRPILVPPEPHRLSRAVSDSQPPR